MNARPPAGPQDRGELGSRCRAVFDESLRRLIDPPLNAAGRWLARQGVGADSVTLAAFGAGLCAAGAAACGQFTLSLVLIGLNRLGDGLDGAVARATTRTDRGAFLDIALDFAFYASLPVAFAWHDPEGNGLAAAVLLASFLANGSAFLAYAIMAERRGLETAAQGMKSIYYAKGLAEGFETAAVFAACCLAPAAFPVIAFAFAAICILSALGRILAGWRTLT